MNTNAQFQSIIFDVDGTMFDTLPSLSAAANEVLVHAGLHEVSKPNKRPALNEGLMPMFRKAIALQPTPVSAENANRLESEYMARYMRHWLLFVFLFVGVCVVLFVFLLCGLLLGFCFFC